MLEHREGRCVRRMHVLDDEQDAAGADGPEQSHQPLAQVHRLRL